MYRTCPRTFYESRVAIHTPITQTKHDKIAACSANGPSPWVCAGGRLIIASISTPIKCPRSRLGSLRKESGGPGQKGARQRTVGRHGGGTVGLDSLRKCGDRGHGVGGGVGVRWGEGSTRTRERSGVLRALCPRPPPPGLLSLAYASFQVSDAHDANMKTYTRASDHSFTPTRPQRQRRLEARGRRRRRHQS